MRWLRRFLSASALAIGCGMILMDGNMIEGGIIASMSLLIWSWNLAQASHEENIQNLENRAIPEPLIKARMDYATIQGNIGMIQDKTLAAQVRQLQATAGKLMKYLDSHTERIPSAMRFIDYYQDRTAALMQQYVALRETGVQTQAMENLQRDMRTTFQGFAVAYEKQFEKVIDNEIRSMDAKLKVARQLMDDEGIDCDKLKTSVAPSDDSEDSDEIKKKNGWNLKHTGMAIGAVALGAFGLWKMFGGDKKE